MYTRFEKQIRERRKLLANPWAYLDGEGRLACSDVPESFSAVPKLDIKQLLGSKHQDSNFTHSEIESITRKVQIFLWDWKDEIWCKDKITDPVNVLDPVAALESIGYSVREEESLGQYRAAEGSFEVAGILNKPTSLVRISRRLDRQARTFTIAHELGHAILHSSMTMHRDRALDGSVVHSQDFKEKQANTFAALFLMPEKQVRKVFASKFLMGMFILNEETAFALNLGLLSTLKNKYSARRDFARLIADTSSFNGKHFCSMAEHFGVSVEAMAIRLEELNLI